MQGALFCHPENIVYAPFWSNPNITRNGKVIKSSFNMLHNKIVCIADMVDISSGLPMTQTQFKDRYNIDIDNDTVIEIHYIIKSTFKENGLKDNFRPKIQLPSRPLLIQIANVTDKGCSMYGKYLRTKKWLKINLSKRENKWHQELNFTLSIDFWNRVYTNTSQIRHNNRIKWLQFQVNRNSLYTNYKVNKVNPQKSPFCTFCNQHFELVSHLFYGCIYTSRLLNDIREWLATLNINLPLEKKVVLFGKIDEDPNSVINYILLCVKNYVWKARTNENVNELSINLFKQFLSSKLNDLKEALEYSNKSCEFDKWSDLYNVL